MNRLRNFVVLAILAIATGCATDELDVALGGDTTRTDATQNAFGLPIANLPPEHRKLFEQGDSFFTQNWVTAPASTVARDGLGPVSNAQGCASCHGRDGRGAPPSGPDDATTRGLLVRLSVPGSAEHGGPVPEPNYGDQFQDRGIEGVAPEGQVSIRYDEVRGQFGDGTPFTLRKPAIGFKDLAYGDLDHNVMLSARLAPQMIGMGLLESIPEKQITDRADPDDKNGDGISGRPNYVWSNEIRQKTVGRFGWKANTATVADQTAGAFAGDIGITSPLRTAENCTAAQEACRAAPNGGLPEVDQARFDAVTFYARSLAVPAMRNSNENTVRDGAKHFRAMGCGSCHTPKSTTDAGVTDAFSDHTLRPFTDLLLHDMGPGLADNRPEFEASGQEWRTPPLWSLGLAQQVNGFRFFLHDGRARSFEESILWHGGEGEAAKEKFRQSNATQRAELIAYLDSL